MKTENSTEKAHGIVIAGVGGQGALTLAQLVLGAAWRSGYYVLQSEIHGMSQRGGAVNAHIIFDKKPVTSPILTEGSAELLIGLEPLETLRYLSLLTKDAKVVSSKTPIINMGGYPEEEDIFKALEKVSNIDLIDTVASAKELNYRHAGNMALLGVASKSIPIEMDIWEKIIAERFQTKGEKVIEQNIKSFKYGRNL